MADIYNLNVDAGSTYNLAVQWKDGSGNPYNISGYTGRMQIRRNINSDTFQVDLTTENGGIEIIDAAAGSFKVVITPTQTASLLNGVYDLEIQDGSGNVTRLLQGSVTVNPEVTR